MPIDAATVKWDSPTIPEVAVQWDAAPDDGIITKIRNAAESVLEPAVTMATGAIALPVGNLIGTGKEIFTGDFGRGTAERTAQQVQSALTYQPRNQGARDNLAKISEMFDASKLAGLPVAGQELPTIMQAAKQQLPYLKAVPSRISNSPEVDMLRSARAAMSPNISTETQALASKLQDMGGKVPLHTLTNNKFLRMAGETLDNLPLSGSTKPGNKLAFNRELIKQIGGSADDGMLTSSSFAPAMNRSGQAIGEMYAKTNIPMDDAFVSDLRALADAQKYQVRDVSSIVNRYIRDLSSMADESGVIPGQALRTHDSALGVRIRSLPMGDLRNQLSDLQETLRDALSRQLSPDDIGDLNVFRKQYAIGKVLEPLVAKSGDAGISPQAVLGQVTNNAAGKHRMAMGAAGDMGDLANIGQRFMKETTSSGTAERGMLVGAALDTGKAIAGMTAGNIYNRLGPALSSRFIRQKAPAPTKPPPLTLAEGPFIQNSPLPRPPIKENKLLSLMKDSPEQPIAYPVETIDFPLRQEVLNSPEIVKATDAFRQEAQRLQSILSNKHIIDQRVKASAAQQLEQLQNEFAAGMKQLGIENAGDANGLRRMLYESERNQLPIQKTFSK